MLSRTIARIVYARMTRSDDDRSYDIQREALMKAGVDSAWIFEDVISDQGEERLRLKACLDALRRGDMLVVWRLDKLCRSLRHLINVVESLSSRRIQLKVLTGDGACIDTEAVSGSLVFAIFAALAEFEKNVACERTETRLHAQSRPFVRYNKMTPAKLRIASEAMKKPGTRIRDLCEELGISRQTLYPFLSPTGELRAVGKRLAELPEVQFENK